MHNQNNIIVVGDMNADILMNDIVGFPAIGKEVIADKMAIALGGSSAITACNCASIGIPTWFCTSIGEDEYGRFLQKILAEKGVHTDYLLTNSDYSTGATLVLNYGQERAMVSYCGAMAQLGIDDLPWDDFNNFSHLHISNLYMQKNIYQDIEAILKKAKSLGLTTSLDMQWDPSEEWAFDYKTCLPMIDLFMPNEKELLELTNEQDRSMAIQKIKPFINTLILKLGEEGCIALTADDEVYVPAFTTPHFVDSIGAGDSFNAGFLKHFIQERTLQQCIEYGNLMGAVNTMAAGGTAAFNEEVLEQNINQIREHNQLSD